MADKYCDHGFYGAVEFVGNIVSGAATLNVTSVTSGRVSLGTLVTGNGIPADTIIATYTTGRGGTGTYTLSKNATATLNGVAISGTYGSSAKDPEWGVAQDGDGTTKTAATPAIVSIDMTTWVFSTASTVSIMGSTAITCTASATTSTHSTTPNAQYSATLTTMIDNLVTAINWHSGTTANIPAGWTARKVQDTVFARRNGNSLELMTRAGSASWNSLIAATFTNVTNASSQSWAGGVGGVWGFIVNTNHETLASPITYGSYGVLAAAILAGVRAAGDNIYLRSDKVIPTFAYSVVCVTPVLSTNLLLPVNFIVDDGTQWTTPANPVLKFDVMSQSGLFLQQSTSYENLIAKWDEETNYYGLVVDGSRATFNAVQGRIIPTLRNYEGIHIINPVACTDTTGGPLAFPDFAPSGECMMRGMLFENRSITPYIKVAATTSSSHAVKMESIRFKNNGYALQHPSVISFGGNGGLFALDIDGIKMEGFTVGSTLFGTQYAARHISIRNAQFGGVTQYGAKMCEVSTPYFTDAAREGVAISSDMSGHAFVRDTRHGFCEWNPLRAYPTLNGSLPDGTKFSIRAHPTTISGRIGKHTPFRLPPIKKINSLADGARQFTVELAVKSTLTPTNDKFWVVVRYIDTAGNLVILSSRSDAGSTLPSSTATWSQQNGSNQPIYDDGGIIAFNKYKITLDTIAGKNLATGTVVSATLYLGFTPSSVSDMTFVDPDIGIV